MSPLNTLVLALAVGVSINITSLDNAGLWRLYLDECIGARNRAVCTQVHNEAFRRNQVQRDAESRVEHWNKIHLGKIKAI